MLKITLPHKLDMKNNLSAIRNTKRMQQSTS